MKILASVCARGGSKGVKNKNIRMLLGKPLIAYTIEALKSWGKAHRIICSTDSEEIRKIAIDYGAEAPFLRPPELATDYAGKLDVFKHMLKICEEEKNEKYDFFYDLDVTAPLRTVKNIDEAFNKILNSDADLLCSAYIADRNPYFNMVELDEKGYAHICIKTKKPIVARQQAPKVYALNASIYILRRAFLMKTSYIYGGKTIIYEMSDTAVDIDLQIDFDFIEFLLKEGKFKFDF